MTDLRTLAQAVVDAPDDDAARVALGRWLGFPRGADPTLSVAVDILAALDAERAQGYARAMGEVVERCEGEASRTADAPRYSGHEAGQQDAFDQVADWAREQLSAAAEKEHGG